MKITFREIKEVQTPRAPLHRVSALLEHLEPQPPPPPLGLRRLRRSEPPRLELLVLLHRQDLELHRQGLELRRQDLVPRPLRPPHLEVALESQRQIACSVHRHLLQPVDFSAAIQHLQGECLGHQPLLLQGGCLGHQRLLQALGCLEALEARLEALDLDLQVRFLVVPLPSMCIM